MDGRHSVRFEPVGVEIEAGEDETVLAAAFRQGVMLMHGCKEGQCASCKSFVLSGEDGEEYELDPYSTFALNDAERDEGYTLLCRTRAYDDLVIELLHYDKELIRSGLPVVDVRAMVVANEPLTRDVRRLVLQLPSARSLVYFPGQYVDVHVPGTTESRSFSMANPAVGDDGLLELVIKVLPGGRFSALLAGELVAGDHLDLTGPFGMFTLRDAPQRGVLLVAGGAGIAPVLALLRAMRDGRSERPATFYYGVRRQEDLCFLGELARLGEDLRELSFVPVVSEPGDVAWTGERGLVTEAVARRETDLVKTDCYVCGPPAMVEAAVPSLRALGADEAHIFYDKFTTTGPG